MSESFLTKLSVDSLSPARKSSLITDLLAAVHGGKVQFSREHVQLVNALKAIRWDQGAVCLETVAKHVFLLAIAAEDAFDNGAHKFLVTRVTETGVFGVAGLSPKGSNGLSERE